MKKNVFKLVCVCFCAFFCASQVEAATAEFRVAAFYPVSKKFRDIYGYVGPSYQLEAAFPVWRCFEAWGNLDGFYKGNRRFSRCCHSRVGIFNGSFGLKYARCYRDRFHLYLGLGASLGEMWIQNRSCCGCEKVSKFIAGGVVKSGLQVDVYRSFFVDLFADYLFQPVKFEKTVDVGGLKAGAGIGVRF